MDLLTVININGDDVYVSVEFDINIDGGYEIISVVGEYDNVDYTSQLSKSQINNLKEDIFEKINC